MVKPRQAPLYVRRGGLLLAAVLVAAAGVRLAVVLVVPGGDFFPDAGTYEGLADSIRENGELVDAGGNRATVAPGYPVFIAGCRVLFGDSDLAYRLPQLVLGVLTVLFVYLLARKIWGRLAALGASALAAIDPFAVFFETLELSEGPALCLLVLTALLAWTARERLWAAPAAGAALALTALVRPGWAMLGIVLVLAALVLPGSDRPRPARVVLNIFFATVALCLAMSPWWIRNHLIFDEFVPLTTGGGATFYESNSPDATGGPAYPQTVTPRLRELPAMGELERGRRLRKDALDWIKANPKSFMKLAAIKFGRTWSPVPNYGPYRKWEYIAPGALAWAVVLLLALGGGFFLTGDRSGKRRIYCLLPAVAVALTHVVLLGSVRYRLPAWPFLEIAAGAALAGLVREMARRRKREPESAPGS